MSIEKFQDEIIQEEGIILSDGTLSLQHLLPKAYDLIEAYNLDTNINKDIESVFEGDKPTFYNQFYGNSKLIQSKSEIASDIWNEDVYSLFNNLCPNGFYFGSSEGDGACIGFFKYDEEEEHSK
ncbi:MAG: hypothetical protein GX638_10685 [Crenarchaeota archaeon]|nr:hypothetical protein [Thermoproteota archaeon]